MIMKKVSVKCTLVLNKGVITILILILSVPYTQYIHIILQATQIIKQLGKVQVDLAEVVAWDVRNDDEESVSQIHCCAQPNTH